MAQNIDIFILCFLAGLFHLPCLIHTGLSLSCLYPTKNVGLSRDPPRDWVVQQHTYQERKKRRGLLRLIILKTFPLIRSQSCVFNTRLQSHCVFISLIVLQDVCFCFFPQIIAQHLDIFINQKVVVLCATTEMSSHQSVGELRQKVKSETIKNHHHLLEVFSFIIYIYIFKQLQARTFK